MTRIQPALVVYTVMCFVVGGCASPRSEALITKDERNRIEAGVREADRRMNDAYEQNNLESYWTFYADDFSWVWDMRGWVTLDDYRKEWTAFVEGGGGVVEIDTEDMRVILDPAGDTAVISSRYSARYRNADGTERHVSYYETDVWMKRDGDWKIVYLHGSQ